MTRAAASSDNVIAMAEAAAATRFAEVTVAAERGAHLRRSVPAGDVLGLIDGEVVEIGSEIGGDGDQPGQPAGGRRRRAGHGAGRHGSGRGRRGRDGGAATCAGTIRWSRSASSPAANRTARC